MRKRRTNEERLALQLSMILWAFEHQPATMSEVADQFGLDIDDAYSELYPLPVSYTHLTLPTKA